MKLRGKKVLFGALLTVIATSIVPVMSNPITAYADDEKTVEGFRTYPINNPERGEADTPWTGSYVWYGKYDDEPMKYRVLSNYTNESGKELMLLDCDYALYRSEYATAPYDSSSQIGGPWLNSEVREKLNGAEFLLNTDIFSLAERSAIASKHQSNTGPRYNYNGDHYYDEPLVDMVYILSMDDVLNPDYGYTSDPGYDVSANSLTPVVPHDVKNREKYLNDQPASWWLRSNLENSASENGCVNDNGILYHHDTSAALLPAVSPAFNIDLGNVLFSSVVAGNDDDHNREYKLTLVDKKIILHMSKASIMDSGTIMAPYSLEGPDSENVTQLSVFILSKPYYSSNSRTELMYYSKVQTDSVLPADGTLSFDLPDDFNTNRWGIDYYVYFIAEDVNDSKESDYSSSPVYINNPYFSYNPHTSDEPSKDSELSDNDNNPTESTDKNSDSNTSNKTTAKKKINGLGTSIIKEPEQPGDGVIDMPWTGSYVWYGAYEGKPLKFRVLDPKTDIFGGNTMLLDCDKALYIDQFDADSDPNPAPGEPYPNDWQYSDIRNNLNGEKFLDKEGVFSQVEKDSIALSNINTRRTRVGDLNLNLNNQFEDYMGLFNDKIFLLDLEDALNPKYGYSYDAGYDYDPALQYPWVPHDVPNHLKYMDGKENPVLWWLRTPQTYTGSAIADITEVGSVLSGWTVSQIRTVSPAMNIDLNKVLFTSVVSGKAGENNAEYKFTLLDSEIKLQTTNSEIVHSGTTTTIPYSISGDHSSNVTQVSVLILDKDNKTSKNMQDAKVLYYGKLNTTEPFLTNGTITFDWPLDSSNYKWDQNCYVYFIAEDVNGIHQSDYASSLCKVSYVATSDNGSVKKPSDKKETTKAGSKKSETKANTSKEATSKNQITSKTTDVESKTAQTKPVINGVGTISSDGTILTDIDGVKYYVSEKIKKADLKKSLKVADKKTGGKYKISKVTKKNGKVVGGTASYVAPYNKNSTKVTIPDNVKISGVKFKITEVNKNSFKDDKNLQSVSIGSNVTKIGANAFGNCSNLKNVNIKSKDVKNIGSNAFKGINSKAKIKVPKKQYKKYTKLIKKAKAPKSAKITK